MKVVRKAGCWAETREILMAANSAETRVGMRVGTREILTAANLAETRAAMKVENWAERMVDSKAVS